MIRHFDIPALAVVLAAGLGGENRGHQVVSPHALQWRRDFLSPLHSEHEERSRGGMAPANREERGLQDRLDQHLFDVFRLHELEDVSQGETVLRPER